jgi:sterol desaturase/sphingolipid hydroxylase (fatty acid hydroxylase superfamily)
MDELSIVWDYITTNFTDRQIFVLGTFLVDNFVFWSFNLALFVCDKYELWKDFKIQKDKKANDELFYKCLHHCLFNEFTVLPALAFFGYPYFAACGIHVRGPIPHTSIFLRDIVVSIMTNDTLFYWTHRLFHHPSIYKYIHKKHHNFRVSVGIAAIYAHPVEDFFANVIPALSGCMLMGSHVIVFWMWLVIRIAETVDAHSGYDFKFSPFSFLPFFNGSSRHDFHHSHNVGCYGAMSTAWDCMMGTDIEYLKYKDRDDRKSR